MKKIIIEEVNRNREIMGLTPLRLMEQWEDDFIKLIGAENMLNKLPGDLIPAEEKLFNLVRTKAPSQADSVMQSIFKGELKNDYPSLYKEIEEELFQSSDDTIRNAFRDSFKRVNPEVAAAERKITSDQQFKNILDSYSQQGQISRVENLKNNLKTDIDRNLPDGAIKNYYNDVIDNFFKPYTKESGISGRKIIQDLKDREADLRKFVDDLGEGGWENIGKKGKKENFNVFKKEINDIIKKLKELDPNDVNTVKKFEELARSMKSLDYNGLQAFYGRSSDWASRNWSKGWGGKILVFFVGLAIAGSLGLSISQIDICIPVIKQAISGINPNWVASCNQVKTPEKTGDDVKSAEVSSDTPKTLEDFKNSPKGEKYKQTAVEITPGVFKRRAESPTTYTWNGKEFVANTPTP